MQIIYYFYRFFLSQNETHYYFLINKFTWHFLILIHCDLPIYCQLLKKLMSVGYGTNSGRKKIFKEPTEKLPINMGDL